MKKTIALGLAVAALAGAGQALALTSDVMGFYRVEGITQNLLKGKDVDPDQVVTQRFRLKYTATINDYVKVVYFGEVDMEWGDNSYIPNNSVAASRNQGGGIGGDTTNLETKNMYIEAKFPGTPLVATIGLQGHVDNFDSNFFGNDAAGLTIKAVTSKVDTEVGWYKFMEGNSGFISNVLGANSTIGGLSNSTCNSGDNGASDTPGCARNDDDADLYFARVTLRPIAGLKVGADLYYYVNQGSFNVAPYAPGAAPALVDQPYWQSSFFNPGVGPDNRFNQLFGHVLPATVTQTSTLNPATGVAPSNLPAQTITTTKSFSRVLTVDRQDLYYAGLNAAYSTPLFGIRGWFLYNWGTMKWTAKEVATTKTAVSGGLSTNDNPAGSALLATGTQVNARADAETKVSGFATSVRADANVAPAGLNFFVRGIYYSKAGDDPEKVKAMFSPMQYSGEIGPFFGDGVLMLGTGDSAFTNGVVNGYVGPAMDAAAGGYGMTGLMAATNFVLPSDKNFYAKAGLGYYRTLSKKGYGNAMDPVTGKMIDRDGKYIGTEVAARVGYKFCGGAFDLSLNAGYMWLGSFYNNTVNGTAYSKTGEHAPQSGNAAYSLYSTTGTNPDALYRAYLMVNVPF